MYTAASFLGFAVGSVSLWATGYLLLSFAQNRSTSTRILAPIAILLVACDFAAKALVSAFIPEGVTIPLVGDFLCIRFVPNYSNNVLFSLLGITIDSRAFHVLSKLILFGVAGVFVAWDLRRREFGFSDGRFRWGVMLVTAGAVSSILDSALRGYVLDFISFAGLVSFDIKDLCITYGIGLTLIAVLTQIKASAAEKKASPKREG